MIYSHLIQLLCECFYEPHEELGVTAFAVYFIYLYIMDTVMHCPDPPRRHEWWPLLLTALFPVSPLLRAAGMCSVAEKHLNKSHTLSNSPLFIKYLTYEV